jgi:hypothetical protein
MAPGLDFSAPALHTRPQLARVHRFLQHEVLVREARHIRRMHSDISGTHAGRSSSPSSLSSQNK